MKPRIAIVAAMEREIEGLVKGWASTTRVYYGRQYKIFSSDHVAVTCGGIGAVPARRAAEAISSVLQPQVLISAGFAGATRSGFEVGAPLTPAAVVDVASGQRYATAFGSGTVATVHAVVGANEKADIFSKFSADAVDMESAGVAEVAQQRGLQFLCAKAISDLPDFDLPPIQQFVGPDGELETGRLVAFAAFRPVMWRQLRDLAAHSARAAETLAQVLGSLVKDPRVTESTNSAPMPEEAHK